MGEKMIPLAQASVLQRVVEERLRQDEQWGGPDHDDDHCNADWLDYIEKQVGNAHRSMNPDEDRDRFVKIAALAVAALESMDRKYP